MEVTYVEQSSFHDSSNQVVYVRSQDGGLLVKDVRLHLASRMGSWVRSAFLPEGYPDTVSPDYLRYQVWDTVQAFASSISGSLTTQAVLEGMGVGDETVTSLAAATTWLLRQGAGMVSQILFTWIKGTDLDHNCKRWRLMADVLNDLAALLELSAPLLPKGTLVQPAVFCAASVFRSLVGVAGGATRAAITQHQALAGNNISDVAAKDGSQETLVNLTALAFNLWLLPRVSGNLALIWALFLLLTGLHLFANFKAVRSLCFRTLNKGRLVEVLESFRRSRGTAVDDPVQVNACESLTDSGEGRLFDGYRVRLGARLCSTAFSKDPTTLSRVRRDLEEDRFSVVVNPEKRLVDVVLSTDHKSGDLLKAYFEALEAIRPSAAAVADFARFKALLVEKGWDVDNLRLATLGWTGHFSSKKTD